MDFRRCGLVAAAIAAVLVLTGIVGLFAPSHLTPQAIVEGGTRVLIGLSLVLAGAMVLTAACRRD